jgi:hypothetical protein
MILSAAILKVVYQRGGALTVKTTVYQSTTAADHYQHAVLTNRP